VNNFSKVASAFKSFGSEKDDPLGIPVAVKIYQDASTEQDTLLSEVAQFIASSGIIFTSNEAGGYWNSFGAGSAAAQ
jgi:hypothetical protein